MKPSDHMIVRLCQECAIKHEVKWRALVRDERWPILLAFVFDSLQIARAYMAHLEQYGGETNVEANDAEAF